MPAILFAHNIYLIDLPLLIVLVSLVYSATRFDRWSAILGEAFRSGWSATNRPTPVRTVRTTRGPCASCSTCCPRRSVR